MIFQRNEKNGENNMKKLLVIAGITAAFVTVLALGLTGFAYAQDTQPVCPNCSEDGWMGKGAGFRGQVVDGEYGPMHEYMVSAMAEALGITPEELEAAHAEGKTAWAIAQEQGKSYDEFLALMQAARSTAFQQMVADGVISQEQADWMLSHMNGGMGSGYGRGGYGAGGCTMSGENQSGTFGPGMHGGRGGRWSTQP